MSIKKVVKIINWIGGLSAIWLLFYPILYKIAVITNILIPIIAIFIAFKFMGKIGIDSRKWDNTSLPKIDSAIIFPAFALILRASIDIKLIEYQKVIIYTSIISIPLVLILLFSTKEFFIKKKIIEGVIWIFLFPLTYGIGNVILINAIFDNTTPKIYKARIINKEVEKGKWISYRIDFEPLSPIIKNDLIRVSKNKFDKLEVNDSIKLEVRNGFLKIPWILK